MPRLTGSIVMWFVLVSFVLLANSQSAIAADGIWWGEGATSVSATWQEIMGSSRVAWEKPARWEEPGGLIRGLHPEVVFYTFVIYTNKDKKMSKPSKAVHFRLKDMFMEK